jgi:hypothetical protein
MRYLLIFLIGLLSMQSFAKDDYSKFGRGLNVPSDWKKKAQFVKVKSISSVALPEAFDWREKVKLSAVKNQGNCGSCWAFSTTATWRDAMIVQAGEVGDGSEQNVLDCNVQRYGCDGGYFDVSSIWVSPGAVREADYAPYKAVKGSCNSAAKKFAKAISWKYIQGAGGGDPTVDDIKTAIMTYGPVSVGVAAGEDWNSYSGGILSGSKCTSKQLNHAVQIVGWGKDHWVVRNSWGTGWGEQGYIRMAYGCDGIGELPNIIVYKDGINPTPNPDPNPTPNPDPTPTPDPEPTPCPLPKVSTGYPAEFQAVIGQRYLMGSKAVKGEKYLWTADPAFGGGAKPITAQIYYKPVSTKKITLTASNKCGSASASSNMVMSEVSLSKKQLKKLKVYK